MPSEEGRLDRVIRHRRAPGAEVPGKTRMRKRRAHRSRSTSCRAPGRSRSRPRSATGGRAERPNGRRDQQSAAVEIAGQAVSGPVPVGDQAGDGGDQAERQEDVEQRDPGHHEVQAVEGEQQAGDTTDQGRPGHPPYGPDHAARSAGRRRARHEPPAERVHPEQLLARGDHPLADLGVHGEARGVLEDVQVAGDDLVGVARPVVRA